MKFLHQKLKEIYRQRPGWAIFLYQCLPCPIRERLRQVMPLADGTDAGGPRKLDRLTLHPLDSAWAEAIFAPFHDPEIAPTLPVDFKRLQVQTASFDFAWCWTVLKWEKCSENGDAVSIELETNIELGDYDRLIACLALSRRSFVRFGIKQNGRWNALEEKHLGTGKRMEVLLPLEAGKLERIKLIFSSTTDLRQIAQLSWLGLRNSELVKQMKENRRQPDPEWPGLIKPVTERGEMKFELNLLFSSGDLEKLREKKKRPGWDAHFRLLEGKAVEYLSRVPEKDLGEYLPYNDTRYLRAAESGKSPYYFEALVLGFVGLVNLDERMISHALRYLMCMVHTKHWAQSAESRLYGSTWDQRCFLEEMTTTSVALLADWFFYALTDRARGLVRQSIWDKGLAVVDRDLMKYEYLYHINQGAVFCRARIFGGLYLEHSWPHLGGYVDRAFSDMNGCLKNYVAADGGVHEGVGYFCQTLQAVLPAAIAYHRRRGGSFERFVKKHFSRSEDFVAAMSGSVPGTAIPEGDCRTGYFSGDAIPILARIFPEGKCARILKSCLETGNVFAVTGTLTNSGGITGFVYGPDIVQESETIVPTFAIMKKSGHLVSFREQGGHSMRCHLLGSIAHPHHSHFDKSNIILECDNEQILVERGMVQYYYSAANNLKSSCMHNVITPVAADGSYPDQVHPAKPVIPLGKGDRSFLQASVDLSGLWGHYMVRCSRSIRSDTPAKFVITDEGRLIETGRIAFHLHSIFPFKVGDSAVTLRSSSSEIIIEAPWAEDIICRQESIDLHHNSVFHLMIHSPLIKNDFFFNTTITVNY